ncbi:hypothetical protein EYE40_08510 [Glaciihabitans arcticus]|uniref:Uncharacterized protein n=1 Tax=Glaciihabitans arcticus TaxID=2668039 RepID=A0A4Q9GYN7_9MICO|nr:hypothetical protein [Glaciihabitans arcticus]TBN57430.1 hypothetical protein EYE40_08510 [Glaciihabitans arcticus]
MGLFSKRAKTAEIDSIIDPIENVTLLAQLRFGVLGVPVEVDPDTAGIDTVLITAAGARYPLYNLFVRTAQANEDETINLVMQHVDSMVEAANQPDIASLSDEDLSRMVRTRIVPRDVIDQISAKYSIRVASDLVALLCVDFPTHVAWLNDDQLADRNIDDLFATGMQNTMGEQVDDVQQSGPISMIVGDSLFIASKVLGMPQLISEHLQDAPHGVLFGVPNRHLIFALPLVDMASIAAAGALATMVANQANADDNPGGTLSADVFIWRAGRIERAGGVNPDGTVQMIGDSLMLEALEGITAAANAE